MFRRTILVALAALLHLPAAAQPATFISSPLRLVVPFMPGGSADNAQRLLAKQLQRAIGRPVVIENRPGPQGADAAIAVRSAPADGNTVLVGTSAQMVVSPVLSRNSGNDLTKEFIPVHGLATASSVWFTASDSPYRVIGDLLAGARNRVVTVGSSGYGYRPAVALLARSGGVRLGFVRHPRMAQIATDVVRRQIDAGVGDIGVVLPLIQAGMVRALAVSGPGRQVLLPDVATLGESGVPDGTVQTWSALFVRAGTPAALVAKLSVAARIAISSPELVHYLVLHGRTPMLGYGPEETARLLRREQERFKRIVDEAGSPPT